MIDAFRYEVTAEKFNGNVTDWIVARTVSSRPAMGSFLIKDVRPARSGRVELFEGSTRNEFTGFCSAAFAESQSAENCLNL